jgi:DNA-binding transcriptional ArsR family regulator
MVCIVAADHGAVICRAGRCQDHPMEMPQIAQAAQSEELEQIGEKARRAADFLKALAHESRLLILCILAEGEKSVTELERILELRQPTVSQQLARLRTDGLVSARREGKTIYYSLASDEARIIIGAIYEVFCGGGKKG